MGFACAVEHGTPVAAVGGHVGVGHHQLLHPLQQRLQSVRLGRGRWGTPRCVGLRGRRVAVPERMELEAW